MHPHQKIIALKGTWTLRLTSGQRLTYTRTAGRQLQIFNLDTKNKVKSHMNAEDIIFWKWANDNIVGLVSETSVYHWSIADPTSPPQKVFDRHASLAGAQIINYRITPDEKWMVLVGISGNTTNPAAFKIKGGVQLFSKERGVSQMIEGHAAAFAELQLEGSPAPTSLFTFSVRTAAGAKVVYSNCRFVILFSLRSSCISWKSIIIPKTQLSRKRR